MFDVFEGVKGNEESNIRGGGRRVRGNAEGVRAEEGRGELENGRPAKRPACLPACLLAGERMHYLSPGFSFPPSKFMAFVWA